MDLWGLECCDEGLGRERGAGGQARSNRGRDTGRDAIPPTSSQKCEALPRSARTLGS